MARPGLGSFLFGFIFLSATRCFTDHKRLTELSTTTITAIVASDERFTIPVHHIPRRENWNVPPTLTNNDLDTQQEPDQQEGSSLSISAYAESALKHPGHTMLLVWDKNGELDLDVMKRTIQNSEYPQWWNGNLMKAKLRSRRRQRTEYGTVALLVNSDIIGNGAIDWSIPPPIPLLAYSIPVNITTPNIYNIPTAYELLGWNAGPIYEARRSSRQVPLEQRTNKIIWRGVIHGYPDPEPARIELCEMGANESNAHWLNATESTHDGPEAVSAEAQSLYRYQIDIGGVSGTTWGALRWKMCSGSLVFKVDDFAQDWWHTLLITPWVHYIPVKADLSDLYEQYQWAEQHPTRVKKIAQAGESICLQSSQVDVVDRYLQKMIRSLPPASQRHAEEAFNILNGLAGPNNKLVSRSS